MKKKEYGESTPRMIIYFYKLSIVFFNMVVFWRVPARSIAKKYSKYKAFLYIKVQAACCVLLFGVVAV